MISTSWDNDTEHPGLKRHAPLTISYLDPTSPTNKTAPISLQKTINIQRKKIKTTISPENTSINQENIFTTPEINTMSVSPAQTQVDVFQTTWTSI